MLGRLGLKLVTATLWRTTVAGAEYVPRSGGVLIAANHISLADGVPVLVGAPRRVAFLVNRTAWRLPWLGALLSAMRGIPVKLDSMDHTALRAAESALTAGEAVLVFPEGHLNPGDGLLPLKPGAAWLALRARVPVVPAFVWGTRAILPYGARKPQFAPARIGVRFGPPLALDSAPVSLSPEAIGAVNARLLAAISALAGERR